MAYQAIQSFSAEFEDGRPALAVRRGEVFPDGHELVRRDMDTSGGRQPGQLFAKLDLGEDQVTDAKPAAAAKPASPKAAAGKAS